MMCPQCRNLYAGTRFFWALIKRRRVPHVACPQCGVIPWRAVRSAAAEPTKPARSRDRV